MRTVPLVVAYIAWVLCAAMVFSPNQPGDQAVAKGIFGFGACIVGGLSLQYFLTDLPLRRKAGEQIQPIERYLGWLAIFLYAVPIVLVIVLMLLGIG